FQAEDGIRYFHVTGVQTCALPIFVAYALERRGRVDTLVNNAGMFAARPLAGADPETVASLFATNVVGPTLLARAALPHLKRTRRSEERRVGNECRVRKTGAPQ